MRVPCPDSRELHIIRFLTDLNDHFAGQQIAGRFPGDHEYAQWLHETSSGSKP
jgi:hypothetical protein